MKENLFCKNSFEDFVCNIKITLMQNSRFKSQSTIVKRDIQEKLKSVSLDRSPS